MTCVTECNIPPGVMHQVECQYQAETFSTPAWGMFSNIAPPGSESELVEGFGHLSDNKNIVLWMSNLSSQNMRITHGQQVAVFDELNCHEYGVLKHQEFKPGDALSNPTYTPHIITQTPSVTTQQQREGMKARPGKMIEAEGSSPPFLHNSVSTKANDYPLSTVNVPFKISNSPPHHQGDVTRPERCPINPEPGIVKEASLDLIQSRLNSTTYATQLSTAVKEEFANQLNPVQGGSIQSSDIGLAQQYGSFIIDSLLLCFAERK